MELLHFGAKPSASVISSSEKYEFFPFKKAQNDNSPNVDMGHEADISDQWKIEWFV